MLEEFISSCDGRVNPIRMYSAAELEKAIGNTKPVFLDRYGNYYKGTYRGRTILIEFREFSGRQGCDDIFNEMAVLSQMKHRNVVKLLGCCLETEIPMLVYEFSSNGRLSDHIKDLSWEDRLRIAAQVADALTDMHTATSRPIIHRDIKPSTILLDDNYSPKVFELGLSVTIPIGKMHVETPVAGTINYMAPEQMMIGLVTEKCDVYSVGQLLLDLLSQTHPGDRMLDMVDEAVDLVMSSIKDKLDAGNWSQGKTEQLLAFAVLASRCLKEKGEERPTMKEVVQELRRIIRSSLETRNTTETENISVEEVLHELRKILRACLDACKGPFGRVVSNGNGRLTVDCGVKSRPYYRRCVWDTREDKNAACCEGFYVGLGNPFGSATLEVDCILSQYARRGISCTKMMGGAHYYVCRKYTPFIHLESSF